MKELRLTVQGASGLHARPASMLVAAAQKFAADIVIEKNGKKVNAKSIMGILGLGSSKGDELVMTISGLDEDAAAQEMHHLFNTVLPVE